MNKLISLCMLLCMHIALFAHTGAKLTGHVIDGSNQEHLPFVNIQIKGTTIGGSTDATGHYVLTDLPEGKFVVVFSMVGYETQSREMIFQRGKDHKLNVTLLESSYMMDDVVVSSNKYETKQKEAATMVNVVSPKLFDVTTSCNVAQVLDFQTGLRVENTCQNCGVTQLRINGLAGEYSQILMDSRPMFSSLAAVYGLEQIPAGMIDRVEVIRGGGSALFGANAIGGVVNIITKEPTHNFVNVDHTASLVDGKSWDQNTNFNAAVVTDDYKAGVLLFGVQRNREKYDRDDDGFTEIPVMKSSTLGARSFFRLSPYSKIILEYHHMHEYRRGGDQLDEAPHKVEIAEQVEHDIDAGSVKYDLFSPDNVYALSIYSSAQHIVRKSYYGTHQNDNAYGNSKDVTSVSGVQYRYSWMQDAVLPADLSAGAEYYYNNLHDRIMGYNRDVRQTIHLYGGYLQNEWKNDVWTFLVGARLEKHNLLKKVVCTPRANVRFTPVQDVVFRMSYSSGYRPPQAFDEDLHVGAVGGEVSLVELAPDLKPEYSHSVSGSVDVYHQWGNLAANLTLEGFFTQLNDVFTLSPNGFDDQNNLLLLRTNESGARIGGVNFETRLTYKRNASLQLGYTWQKSRYIEPMVWSNDERLAPQRRMFRTPDHYGYAIFTYEPIKRLNVAVNAKYTGPMLIQHFAGYISQDEEIESPSFVECGFKLSYDIPIYKTGELTLNAGVKNLFDSFQKDLDRGSERDASYMYGPTLPRTVFVGMSIKL